MLGKCRFEFYHIDNQPHEKWYKSFCLQNNQSIGGMS